MEGIISDHPKIIWKIIPDCQFLQRLVDSTVKDVNEKMAILYICNKCNKMYRVET